MTALALLLALTATWTDHSGGTASTRLERRLQAEAEYAVLVDVPPGVTEYVDAAVAPATAYCYRALAWNEAGQSPYSEEACATAPAVMASLVVTVSGAGKVTSNPAGIDRCTSVCSTAFPPGTILTLVATPNNRSQVFAGWTGPCATAPATCAFLLDGPTQITATFRHR